MTHIPDLTIAHVLCMFDLSNLSELWNEHENLEEYTDSLLCNSCKNAELLQVSKGGFCSRSRIVRLNTFTVAIRNVRAAYTANFINDPNIYTFVLCKNSNGTTINGDGIDSNSLYLIKPGQDVFAKFTENETFVTLRISKSHLDRYLRNTEISISDERIIERYQSASIVRELAGLLLSIVFHSDHLARQAKLDAEERGMLILERLLSNSDLRYVSLGTRYRIVVRAKEYINSHNCVIPSVMDVCRGVHCSLRTLEYSFEKVTGVTPKKYFILLRMHNIRQEILSNPKINRLALLDKYGVVNPSRFYREYNAWFGVDLRGCP